MGVVMRRLSDPRVLVGATVAFLGPITLVWLSGTDMFIGWLLLIVPLGWGLLGAYGVLSFVRAARDRGDRWLERQAIGWTSCLVVSTVTLQLGWVGASENVRIWISADALASAGERVLAGEHPTRAALYGFDQTRVMDGCALMTTARLAIDESGWAYCPQGQPSSQPFNHVRGSLYSYSFD